MTITTQQEMDRARELRRLRNERAALAELAFDPHLTPDPAQRREYRAALNAVQAQIEGLGAKR